MKMQKNRPWGLSKVLLLTTIILLVIGVLFVGAVAISWEHIYKVRKNTKTPYDYPGSVWRSEEPFVELVVPDYFKDVTDSDCRIVVEGNEIKVVFSPGLYPQNSVFKRGQKMVLRCKAKYSETKVVLTVLEDHISDEEYRKIILIRQK